MAKKKRKVAAKKGAVKSVKKAPKPVKKAAKPVKITAESRQVHPQRITDKVILEFSVTVFGELTNSQRKDGRFHGFDEARSWLSDAVAEEIKKVVENETGLKDLNVSVGCASWQE